MKKTVIILVILALVAALGLNSIFTVREDQFACTVRFSQIIDTTAEAGLSFKLPFLDSIRYFSKATQFYDIPPSEVLTSDKQNMTVDCYILWSITDPKLFYQTLGSTGVAEDRLNALTYNELKTVMGTLAQADIINMADGAERNQIYNGIAAAVDELAKTYGIGVDDVIKRDLGEGILYRFNHLKLLKHLEIKLFLVDLYSYVGVAAHLSAVSVYQRSLQLFVHIALRYSLFGLQHIECRKRLIKRAPLAHCTRYGGHVLIEEVVGCAAIYVEFLQINGGLIVANVSGLQEICAAVKRFPSRVPACIAAKRIG